MLCVRGRTESVKLINEITLEGSVSVKVTDWSSDQIRGTVIYVSSPPSCDRPTSLALLRCYCGYMHFPHVCHQLLKSYTNTKQAHVELPEFIKTIHYRKQAILPGKSIY